MIKQTIHNVECLHSHTPSVEQSFTKEFVPTTLSQLDNDCGFLSEEEIDQKIADADISDRLNDYATKVYVGEEIDKIDITDLIKDFATKTYVGLEVAKVDVTNLLPNYATKTYVGEEIAKIDVTDSLTNYATKTYVGLEISKIDVSDQLEKHFFNTEIPSDARELDLYYKSELAKRLIDAKIENITSDKSLVGFSDNVDLTFNYKEVWNNLDGTSSTTLTPTTLTYSGLELNRLNKILQYLKALSIIPDTLYLLKLPKIEYKASKEFEINTYYYPNEDDYIANKEYDSETKEGTIILM